MIASFVKYLFLAVLLVIISLFVLFLYISYQQMQENKRYEKAQYDRLKPSGLSQYLPKEDFNKSESGKFAHSLNYEDKMAKPVPFEFNSNAKFDEESERYFEHLCATEGKEYIYKTADNVTSVAQLRSFEYPDISERLKQPNNLSNQDYLLYLENVVGKKYIDVALELENKPQPDLPDEYIKIGPDNATSYKSSLYGLEAPLFFDEDRLTPYYRIYRSPEVPTEYENKNFGAIYRLPYYHYEIVFNNGLIYDYYYDKKENEERVKKDPQFTYDKILKYQKLEKLNSRYGWTWRGFSRPNDRELGIAGADMIIIDLQTNEIMAIQRGFMKGFVNIARQDLNWDGIGCFEHYKNSRFHENDNFEGKTFKEKRKTIRSQETTMGILAPFLHKVLKPEDKVLTSYAGDKIYPNKPKIKTQE